MAYGKYDKKLVHSGPFILELFAKTKNNGKSAFFHWIFKLKKWQYLGIGNRQEESNGTIEKVYSNPILGL